MHSKTIDFCRPIALFLLTCCTCKSPQPQHIEYADQSASDASEVSIDVDRHEAIVPAVSLSPPVDLPKVHLGSVVMLIGDSLAVGMSDEFKKLSTSAGYVPRTHAVGGTNALQWKNWIGKDLETHRPTLVLISLGTNDAAGYDVVKKSGVFFELVKIIEKSGAYVAWIGPPAIKKQRIPRIEETRSIIKEAAPIYFPSENVKLHLGDGIHTDPSGYRTWIREVWQCLSARGIVASQK